MPTKMILAHISLIVWGSSPTPSTFTTKFIRKISVARSHWRANHHNLATRNPRQESKILRGLWAIWMTWSSGSLEKRNLIIEAVFSSRARHWETTPKEIALISNSPIQPRIRASRDVSAASPDYQASNRDYKSRAYSRSGTKSINKFTRLPKASTRTSSPTSKPAMK